VVSDILSFKPEGKGTDLSAGLTYLSQISKRKSVAFLISDFMAKSYEKSLRIVSRKHDLVPVVIADPFEAAFPSMGLVDLEDPETGERVTVDASDPLVRGHFAEAMKAVGEERRKLFKKLELDHVELQAGEDYVTALTRFFKARAKRMAA
jgi:hypothetical protein